MKKVIIASDGGARGNGSADCISAYGALLEFKTSDGKVVRKEISKGFIGKTNNQMELMGFIAALKCLNQSCEIDAYLDSKYVLDGCKSWLEGWKKNNWNKSKKNQVKNIELWQELDILIQKHKINYNWVKGHSLSIFYSNGIDINDINIKLIEINKGYTIDYILYTFFFFGEE